MLLRARRGEEPATTCGRSQPSLSHACRTDRKQASGKVVDEVGDDVRDLRFGEADDFFNLRDFGHSERRSAGRLH
jgi:hypothetical protein